MLRGRHPGPCRGAAVARLPSTRVLMVEHGVGPGTVSRAIARLAAEGVLVAESGRGPFVAVRPARRRAVTTAIKQSTRLRTVVPLARAAR